jgi:hypothetical protein
MVTACSTRSNKQVGQHVVEAVRVRRLYSRLSSPIWTMPLTWRRRRGLVPNTWRSPHVVHRSRAPIGGSGICARRKHRRQVITIMRMEIAPPGGQME